MDDINLDFNTDNRKINLEGDKIGDSSINIQKNTDDLMGVELLRNNNKSNDTGYSSGEESNKGSQQNKGDYDFFNDDKFVTFFSQLLF